MKKKTKIYIAVCMAVFFYLFIVSLFGENKRITDVVYNYTENIKSSDFKAADFYLSENFLVDDQGMELTRKEFEFLYLLSVEEVLKTVDLSKSSIRVKAERFWIPFTEKNRVNVCFFSKDDPEKRCLRGITSQREKGKWKIASFVMDDQSLKSVFSDVVKKYRTLSSDKILENYGLSKLNQASSLSEREKKVLGFKLNMMIKGIRGNQQEEINVKK